MLLLGVSPRDLYVGVVGVVTMNQYDMLKG